MKSGMLAAEAAFNLIQQSSEDSQAVQAPADMSAYATAFKNSWVHSELHEIRNLRPSFNTPLGIFGGIAYSGVDSLLLKGRTPWTFRNHSKKNDAQHTGRAANFKPIEYPAPVPPLSTDLLTALVLTGTNHAEDQTVHLRVTGPDGQETPEIRSDHVRRNVEEFAGLLGRACPAGVYEYVETSEENNVGGWNGHKLVINSQVCVFVGVAWIVLILCRIVYIVSCVISKFQRKILLGPCQRAAADQNTVSKLFTDCCFFVLTALAQLLRSHGRVVADPALS
jgi:electron-transferring-flavoprotein dehydrogenase